MCIYYFLLKYIYIFSYWKYYMKFKKLLVSLSLIALTTSGVTALFISSNIENNNNSKDNIFNVTSNKSYKTTSTETTILSIKISSNSTSLIEGDILNINPSISFSDGNDYSSQVTYSWEKISTDLNTWESIANTNSLTINPIDLTWNNSRIRLKVTFNNKIYYSNILNIIVNEKPYIQHISIESDKEILCEKDDLNLSSTLSFIDNVDHVNEVTYNWEMLLPSSSTWQSISTEKSYRLSNITLDYNNAKFRLTCSLNGKSIQSNILTIKVNSLPYVDTITIISSLSTTIEGQKLELIPSLVFTDHKQYSEGINYVWERQRLNSTNWEKISSGKVLSIQSLSYSWNSSKIRLKTIFNGKEVISNELTLDISRIPMITEVNVSGLEPTYNVNSTLSLNSSISTSSQITDTENIKYSWEVKKYNQNIWQNISNTSNLNFDITDISYNSSKIRLRTTYNNYECTSNELILNVMNYDSKVKNIDIIGIENKYNIGDSINLTAKITLYDNQVNSSQCGYQWQILKNNVKSNWENIGSNQPTLSIPNITKEYAGCKLRLIPFYNNMQLNTKIKEASNNIIISGVNDQKEIIDSNNVVTPRDVSFLEENWFYFAIGGGALGGFILLVVLILIIVRVRNKNKREEEIRNRLYL